MMNKYNYVSFGNGPRALVVIPGLSPTKVTDNPEALRAVFGCFLDSYKVYVFERPDEVPDGCTNSWLAANLAGAMEDLGIGQADVIGVSHGGMIAQYLAVDFPEKVHALVLGSSISTMSDAGKEAVSCWMKLAREKKYYEMNMDMFRRIYSDAFLAKNGALAEAMAHVEPFGGDRFIRLCKACLGGGPCGRLGAISCPVYVMGGSDDKVLSTGASEQLAHEIGCKSYIYKGFGHSVYDESPDFYPRCKDFFTTVWKEDIK